MSINPAHVPYAKETALCVDFAYESVESDIRTELDRADGSTQDALKRVLAKLRDRRSVLEEFTGLTLSAASNQS